MTHAHLARLVALTCVIGAGRPAASVAQVDPGPTVSVRSEVYATAPAGKGNTSLVVDLYRAPGEPIKGAVVLMHGGGFTGGHRELAENRAYGEALARRGYLVAAISYRLLGDAPVVEDAWAAAYADMVRAHDDPRMAAAIRQFGPSYPDAVAAAAVDLSAAVEWLNARAGELGFQPGKIAVFGASAGAITALTTAYAMDAYGAPDLDVAAVIDLRGLMVRPETSPNFFGPGDPPLMILHGEADQRVPLTDAEEVFRLAKEGGTPVELHTVEGFGHELGGGALLGLGLDRETTVLDRIDAFLEAAFAGAPERRSIRGRLVPADGADADITSDSDGDLPDDPPLREQLAEAVADLVAAVRAGSGVVASLYGLSKSDALEHEFDDITRRDWSYWPRDRRGLAIGHMDAAERERTHRVLTTVLSSKGYLQVNHVMLLEEVLAATETRGFLRGSEDYQVAVFGQPSPSGPWGIRFEGHHVSLNVTVASDRIYVTPSFLGASPVPIPSGIRAGFSPFHHEQRFAYHLLSSLDEGQRTAAVLSDAPPVDVLTSQFQVDSTEWSQWRSRLARDGVLASTFDPHQLRMLRRLLEEIVGVYDTEIVRTWLETLDIRTLAFAWMGSLEPGRPHYFRIQGEDFVFELDAAQENGTHVHTVWRDRRLDLGGEALAEHYRSHAHR